MVSTQELGFDCLKEQMELVLVNASTLDTAKHPHTRDTTDQPSEGTGKMPV